MALVFCHCYGYSSMFNDMIILIIYISILSSISCSESNKDQRLSAWGDWWNIFSTSEEPFIWEPTDWNVHTTTEKPLIWVPTDWDVYTTTEDPYILEPTDWDPSGDDYGLRNDNSKLFIAVITVIICFFLLVFMFCLKVLARDMSRSSPSNISQERRTTAVESRSIPSERPHIVVEFIPHPVYRPYIPNNSAGISTVATVYNNRSSAIDNPPGYDDVVLSDLSGTDVFSEVKNSVPETPPPKYSADNTLRF